MFYSGAFITNPDLPPQRAPYSQSHSLNSPAMGKRKAGDNCSPSSSPPGPINLRWVSAYPTSYCDSSTTR